MNAEATLTAAQLIACLPEDFRVAMFHELMALLAPIPWEAERLIADGPTTNLGPRPTAVVDGSDDDMSATYIIRATIERGSSDLEVVAAFDPTIVAVRVQREFPDAELDPTDYAWRMLNACRRHGSVDEFGKVFDLEASDARRRGPIRLFRIPAPKGDWIRGSAERHRVWFHDEKPIPEPLRSRLLDFVERLRFAPCVTVQSVCWVGDEELPM